MLIFIFVWVMIFLSENYLPTHPQRNKLIGNKGFSKPESWYCTYVIHSWNTRTWSWGEAEFATLKHAFEIVILVIFKKRNTQEKNFDILSNSLKEFRYKICSRKEDIIDNYNLTWSSVIDREEPSKVPLKVFSEDSPANNHLPISCVSISMWQSQVKQIRTTHGNLALRVRECSICWALIPRRDVKLDLYKNPHKQTKLCALYYMPMF